MTRLGRALRVLAVGLVGLALLLIATTVVERLIWRGKVLPGVQLAGARVSGTAAGKLDEVLARAGARLETEPLVARAGSTTLTLDPSEIGLRVDPAETAAWVAGAGRSGNPFAQTVGTVLRLARGEEVHWSVAYDARALDAILGSWERRVGTDAQDGTVRFVDGRVVPVMPRAGLVLARPEADRALVHALRSGRRATVVLPVELRQPVITSAEVTRTAARARRLVASPVTVQLEQVRVVLQPRQLASLLEVERRDSRLHLVVDRSRLREQLGPAVADLEREPENARFEVTGSRVGVVPHVTGRKVDLGHLASLILRGQRLVTGRFRETKPATTSQDLEKLRVRELISSFTTYYPAGQNRVKNIQRAAQILNNHLVMPGEVFSLNQVLGPRTPDNGFVRAPVIYAGEYTEDVGGGVSQVATTVFNAVWFAGYPILEYQPHSFYISRYPKGREATVSWPKPDLRFRNNTDAAILIRAGATATAISVSFYSTKTVTVKTLGPETVRHIPIPEQFVADPSLKIGQREVRQRGEAGEVVRVWRILLRDGKEVARKAYVTTYKPMKRIVAVHPCDHPDESVRPGKKYCKQLRTQQAKATSSTTSTTKPTTGSTTPPG